MYTHVPVLLDEVLAALNVHEDGCYLDGTFGRGGHATAILARLGARGRLIALDRDPQAIAAARAQFANEPRVSVQHASFSRMSAVAEEFGVKGALSGVLLDLGVSSPQLDEAARGFSFSQEGPLDMRMDNTSGATAAQWIVRASERDIASAISAFGQERYAKMIARAIVAYRKEHPITTTKELAEVIANAVPKREPGKHPATRTFQAIRIALNGELAQLEEALKQSLIVLRPGGRLCVISFHSLEDTMVKKFMQQNSREDEVYAGLPNVPPHARPKLKRIGKAVHPTEVEIERNPRARSAVLRTAERLAA
jgi:16S rRNA (cytosine1402-N4)-methyltransferase